MKSLNLFLPYLLPQCLGAPSTLAKQALRSAAIDFCQRTNIVQRVTTQLATVDQEDYDMEIPSQMSLVRILAVAYGSNPLELVEAADVVYPPALRGTVDAVEPASGVPTVAFFKTPSGSTFTVYPVPDETNNGMFTVRACFAPTRTATQVDDELYDRWLETVVAGAAAILQELPGQSFTSASLALNNKMKFERTISMARAESRKGLTLSSTRVRPVKFA